MYLFIYLLLCNLLFCTCILPFLYRCLARPHATRFVSRYRCARAPKTQRQPTFSLSDPRQTIETDSVYVLQCSIARHHRRTPHHTNTDYCFLWPKWTRDTQNTIHTANIQISHSPHADTPQYRQLLWMDSRLSSRDSIGRQHTHTHTPHHNKSASNLANHLPQISRPSLYYVLFKWAGLTVVLCAFCDHRARIVSIDMHARHAKWCSEHADVMTNGDANMVHTHTRRWYR